MYWPGSGPIQKVFPCMRITGKTCFWSLCGPPEEAFVWYLIPGFYFFSLPVILTKPHRFLFFSSTCIGFSEVIVGLKTWLLVALGPNQNILLIVKHVTVKKWFWTLQEIYLGVLFQLSMPLNDTEGVLWAMKESEVPSWAIYCLLIIGDEKQCDGVDKEETQVPWPVFCTWLYQEHRCWTSYMALLFPSSSLPTSWVSYLKQLLHFQACLCSTD